MIDLNEYKDRFSRLGKLSSLNADIEEIIDRAISAESERDVLKAKLAEVEAQEPVGYLVNDHFFKSEIPAIKCAERLTEKHVNSVVEKVYLHAKPAEAVQNAKPKERELRQLYIDMTNCDYYGEDDSALGHMVPSKMIDLFGELIGFTDKPKESVAQRITEQDLREIIWDYFNAGEFIGQYLYGKGRTLLAKLNEHREPAEDAKDPFIWVWQHANGKVASDVFNTEFSCREAWGSFSDSGKAIPLFKVTPNKAEVPEAYTDADIDRRLGKILKASGSALAHFTMHKTRHDMRVAMREAISIPPIKGDDKC